MSSSDNLQIELTYVPQISNSTGWLDYIELNAERELNFLSVLKCYLQIVNLLPQKIENTSSTTLAQINRWDITNKNDVVQKSTFSNNQAQIFSKDDLCNEFIIFTNSNYLDPSFYGKIENQNLKKYLVRLNT